jgi:hypothetical protein
MEDNYNKWLIILTTVITLSGAWLSLYQSILMTTKARSFWKKSKYQSEMYQLTIVTIKIGEIVSRLNTKELCTRIHIVLYAMVSRSTEQLALIQKVSISFASSIISSNIFEFL